MSQTLTLPDEIYSALQEAARDQGTSPEQWIADQLEQRSATKRRTLADLMRGKLRVVWTGPKVAVAENASKIFGEILEQKHREGRL